MKSFCLSLRAYFMYCDITTNLSAISSAIPLALVPSVSQPLPFIARSLINSSKITIIMHQAMILTVQACIFSLVSPPNLIVITDLVSVPGISFSTTLSWPHGTEFADSYLKLMTFTDFSLWLSCDHPDFCYFFEDVPFAMLQRLADIDYRKSLIADRMSWELWDPPNGFVFGIWATAKTLSHTVFERIRTERIDELDPAAFLLVCFKYDYPQ